MNYSSTRSGHAPRLRHVGAVLGVLWVCVFSAAAARADTIRGCVQFNCGNATSGSWPALASGDAAWQSFDGAIATPKAGKRMAVRFLPSAGDNSGFPLQSQPSTVVQITAGTAPAVTCTTPPPSPVPALVQGSPPQCFYEFESGNTMRLHYQGLFPEGQTVRWTIQNLLPKAGTMHTVENFDSSDPKNVFTGVSLGVPAPTASASRDPARLVLVFDKSGSLDWSARPDDPACGSYGSPAFACRRWNILKAAAAQLLAVADAYRLPNDELAVVLFDTSATVSGGGFSPMDGTTLGAVSTLLNGTTPGGGTSVGAGVTAMQSALSGSDNADFNNMIMLFTDGEQNTAPYLRSSTSSLLINPTSPIDLGSPFPPAGKSWRTCVFWLRTDDPSAPEMTALNERISENGCTLLEGGVDPRNAVATLDPSSTELVEFFLGILQATLIGDKLEFVHVSKGVLSTPSASAQTTFKGAKEDVALTFLIDWMLGRETPRNLRLEKDGVVFDPLLKTRGAEIDSGSAHLAVTLRPPFCNSSGECVSPGGEWKLSFGSDGGGEPWPYGLFIMADNRSLSSVFRVGQSSPGVGKPLQLSAVLDEAGVPVTGLPAGAVRAVVSGPDAGLGNVLSEAEIAPVAIDINDPVSPAGLKTRAMRGDPALAARLQDALGLGAGQTVTLSETDPGIYAGEFAGTGAEGIYQIRFEVDGQTAGNGAYTRVWTADRYVAVVPDATATAIQTEAYTCDLAGQCFIVTLRPADTAGNLLGPGKTTLIQVGDFNGKVLSPISDRLDGSYTLRVGYDGATREPPVLDVQGTAIALPPVDTWDGTKPGWMLVLGPYWWLYLIILVLLILGIVYWLLRRGP